MKLPPWTWTCRHIRTLCNGPETPKEWTSDRMSDQPTYSPGQVQEMLRQSTSLTIILTYLLPFKTVQNTAKLIFLSSYKKTFPSPGTIQSPKLFEPHSHFHFHTLTLSYFFQFRYNSLSTHGPELFEPPSQCKVLQLTWLKKVTGEKTHKITKLEKITKVVLMSAFNSLKTFFQV